MHVNQPFQHADLRGRDRPPDPPSGRGNPKACRACRPRQSEGIRPRLWRPVGNVRLVPGCPRGEFHERPFDDTSGSNMLNTGHTANRMEHEPKLKRLRSEGEKATRSSLGVWCRRRDLNPHGGYPPPPQDGVSANSTTSAQVQSINTNSTLTKSHCVTEAGTLLLARIRRCGRCCLLCSRCCLLRRGWCLIEQLFTRS